MRSRQQLAWLHTQSADPPHASARTRRRLRAAATAIRPLVTHVRNGRPPGSHLTPGAGHPPVCHLTPAPAPRPLVTSRPYRPPAPWSPHAHTGRPPVSCLRPAPASPLIGRVRLPPLMAASIRVRLSPCIASQGVCAYQTHTAGPGIHLSPERPQEPREAHVRHLLCASDRVVHSPTLIASRGLPATLSNEASRVCRQAVGSRSAQGSAYDALEELLAVGSGGSYPRPRFT